MIRRSLTDTLFTPVPGLVWKIFSLKFFLHDSFDVFVNCKLKFKTLNAHTSRQLVSMDYFLIIEESCRGKQFHFEMKFKFTRKVIIRHPRAAYFIDSMSKERYLFAPGIRMPRLCDQVFANNCRDSQSRRHSQEVHLFLFCHEKVLKYVSRLIVT